jgi:hypothetical protein
LAYAGSNFDDPMDQASIWLGFWLYERYEVELTEDQFTQAIADYAEFLRLSY